METEQSSISEDCGRWPLIKSIFIMFCVVISLTWSSRNNCLNRELEVLELPWRVEIAESCCHYAVCRTTVLLNVEHAMPKDNIHIERACYVLWKFAKEKNTKNLSAPCFKRVRLCKTKELSFVIKSMPRNCLPDTLQIIIKAVGNASCASSISISP